MSIAMLSIPVVDGLAKYLSASYSALFLSWARYAVAGLLVLPLAAWQCGPRVFPAERRAAHVLRTVFTPAEFGNFMAEETEKWGKVNRAANIKAE